MRIFLTATGWERYSPSQTVLVAPASSQRTTPNEWGTSRASPGRNWKASGLAVPQKRCVHLGPLRGHCFPHGEGGAPSAISVVRQRSCFARPRGTEAAFPRSAAWTNSPCLTSSAMASTVSDTSAIGRSRRGVCALARSPLYAEYHESHIWHVVSSTSLQFEFGEGRVRHCPRRSGVWWGQ